ncbi:MAG: DUF3108 domain-containing protein [Verrucomicrobiales bacterium]|nr:DUF3108 domain-containing protein [Verrucomicrobiales bacterium]
MKFRISALFATVLLPWTFVSAQSVGPPQWMKEVTRLPPGDNANLRPVKLAYTLAWNNRVNAGEFEISIVRNEGGKSRFIGDAKGKSTGFARLLWPYDFRARSIVDESSLRPITFQLVEKERNESSNYDIIFEDKRQIFTTTSKKDDEEARTATSRFSFDFGQDVLSSAFYLRSQELKQGEKITMLVTPFNRPYVARLQVIGREERKIKGRKYKTIKLDATIGKVNEDLTLKHYEKIKKTTLWVSNDEYRIPLELQSQISVGFVSARINDLNWLE